MKAILALALLLILAQEAEACHRFSAWFYPYPQRCPASHWVLRAAFRVIPAVVDPTAPSPADIALLRAAMIADAKGRVGP